MARPRSVEIYLQEGVPEDDYIHDISRMLVSQGRGRRQDIFRRALMIGLTTLLGPEGHSHVEPRRTLPAVRRRKRVVVSDARVESKPSADPVGDFLEAELTDLLQAEEHIITELTSVGVRPADPAQAATPAPEESTRDYVPTPVPEQTPGEQTSGGQTSGEQTSGEQISGEQAPPPQGRPSRRLGRLM
ncbi:hypothetical protein LDL36_16890 [Komagataeibacter sp. FNDCR1]|nr:hypothetical protein [Komagataeibacter sp. FNDCR1]